MSNNQKTKSFILCFAAMCAMSAAVWANMLDIPSAYVNAEKSFSTTPSALPVFTPLHDNGQDFQNDNDHVVHPVRSPWAPIPDVSPNNEDGNHQRLNVNL